MYAEHTAARYGLSPRPSLVRPAPATQNPALDQSRITPPRREMTQVLDRLTHGIVITDDLGRIVYANASAEDIVGLSCKHMLARSMVETLVVAGYDMGGEDSIQAPANGAGPYTIQLESNGADLRCVELRVTVLSSRRDGIDGELYELRDVSDSRQRTRQLLHEASHDPLTGLANRRALSERLGQTLQWPPQERAESALAMLDLDGFKSVNDQCGHLAGDALLCAIANILQGHIRKADMAARLGGDEFVVLLVGCGRQEAARIMQSICNEISAYSHTEAGQSYRVTASVGVVLLDSQVSDSRQALQRADKACYQAKHQGGERVCFDPRADVTTPHTEAPQAAALDSEPASAEETSPGADPRVSRVA